MKNLEELAAALDSHQVTDEQGQIEEEETSQEDTATFETKTPEEDFATAEKSAEPEDEATKALDEGDENDVEDIPTSEHAEDEAGNRYIPEKRFKDIYGKWKAAERKLQESQKAQPAQGNAPIASATTPQPLDKTEALEIEMLFTKMPEFDPESESYSPDLDRLGAKLLAANPGYTRLQAAREAKALASKFANATANEVAQARAVKASQADQGITNRVVSRQASTPDPDNMTLEEKEAYLKSIGQW